MKETIQDVLQLILQADDIKYVKNSGILNYGLDLKQNKNIALLSDVLGHESLNTTAIYLRLSAAEQKKQIDKTVNW